MRILKPLPGILPMPGYPLADAFSLWPMNSLGNKIFDLSNGNTGTFSGDPTWYVGKTLGIDFDGNDKIDLLRKFNPETLPFTVVCSFEIDVLGDFQRLVDSDVNTNFTGFWLQVHSDNTLQICYGDGGGVTVNDFRSGKTNNTLSANTLYHAVVVVRGPNDMEIWLNGSKQAIIYDFAGGAMDPGTGVGAIGALYVSGGWFYLDGKIYHIIIYDRDLFASEITKLYQEHFCMFSENIMPEFAISA